MKEKYIDVDNIISKGFIEIVDKIKISKSGS